ncbi:Phosphatidylglycerol/phosphatidylinositol transfer protein [Porites harrisoni]
MAKLGVVAVFSLCSIVLASCEPVKFKDCGSKESKLEEVDITPCPAQPCQMKRGTNATVEVKFIPNKIISKAKTVVYGIIGGREIPFPGVREDACQDQGLTCPLKPGTENTFKTVLPVKPFYPKIIVDVKWELQDQDTNMVYCFELPVQIV